MRIFIAVFPPPETIDALEACIGRVRQKGDGVSWVQPRNLHYTLRFLGELEEGRTEAASRAVESLARAATPFDMGLGAAGAFPNFRRPRVLWIGSAEGAEELEVLAQGLQEELSREGFGRPDKPFRAHLTVGRIRDSRRAERAVERFSKEKVEARFQVRKIEVIHSTLSPGGSIYRPLTEATLGSARDR